jgi:hypothetical protein
MKRGGFAIIILSTPPLGEPPRAAARAQPSASLRPAPPHPSTTGITFRFCRFEIAAWNTLQLEDGQNPHGFTPKLELVPKFVLVQLLH